MRNQTLKRYLAYSLLAASFALSASSATAQDRRALQAIEERPIIQNSCPRPLALTLTANTPYVEAADFNATQLGAPRSWLNDPAPNKSFLYTFRWTKDERCCEVARAILTVKMKSIQGGRSKTSSDAGNDGIAIMHLGSVVTPYSQAVYGAFPPLVSGTPQPTYPFPGGQPSIKQWTLTGAALNNLNANQRLSIYIQDDTKVESATLQLSGCCLSGPRRDVADSPLSIASPN